MNTYDYTHYKSDINIGDNNESRSIIYSLIEPNSSVLDVGCACGDLGIILHSNKNCRVYGLEYVEDSVNVARSTNAYVDVYQCDLNDINFNNYEKLEQGFDYIVLGDILEHLYNPQELMFKLSKLLKDDGYFIVSIPNFSHASVKISLLCNQFEYDEYGTLDGTHIRFFTFDSFLKIINNLNLYVHKLEYTVCNRYGSMAKLDYKKVPWFTMLYILSDWQSYCFQYIFKLSKQENKDLNLATSNHIIKNAKNYTLLKSVKNKDLSRLFRFK